MRCIIAGSRDGVTFADVERAVRESGWSDEIATVLTGGAAGADRLGERWAERYGRGVERFDVSAEEWQWHGKAAGPMRNRRMAACAHACIVVWDGESPGSRNMIHEARRAGIGLHVHRVGVICDRI